MSNATVSEQLQQMWRTRPYRLPGRGHVAGVAAGIGYRYGVDPVLVRVALVVGTIFGGAGILLYLAAWLLFSKAGDSASPAESLMGKGNSSDSNTKIVVLVVALIIAVTTIGPVGVGMGGSGLISMSALLAGLWLLHQRRPEPPEFLPDGAQVYAQQGFPISFNTPYRAPNPWAAANYRPPQYDAGRAGSAPNTYTPYTTLPERYVPTSPSVGAPSAPATPTAPSEPTVDLNKPGHDSAPTPPSWDPLGVAPFAWDLPEPASARAPETTEQPKKSKSRWTTTFIGLAIVAAAATAGLAAAKGVDTFTPARVGAVALAVVAVGLMLGAFVRRGYGLLVVTGPLLAFVVFASIVGPMSFDSQYTGTQRYAPTTAAALNSDYTAQFGELDLDLTGLQLTQDEVVSISVTAGNAIVRVPDTMNIVTNCSNIIGSTNCGPAGVLQEGNSAEDGPVLTIDAIARAGNVEVKHE